MRLSIWFINIYIQFFLEVGIQEKLRRLFPFFWFFARKPLSLAHHKKKLIGT
jgi:hypothetical protein